MKKIIIGIPSLVSGGVEVSLVRFIKQLSANKDLDVTLFMLEKKGMYLDDIPDNVKIVEAEYVDYIYEYNKSIKDIFNIKGFFKKYKFFVYRNKLRKLQKKELWKQYYDLILSNVIIPNVEYDLAIDWHGYGHFITAVISNIKAKRRAMWIHDERNSWISKIEDYLDCYDKIFCVGQACLNNVLKERDYLSDKLEVFYNMNDYMSIRKRANESMDFVYDKDKLNIITIGRLEWQKAHDVAINIASKLRDRNINFCWYVIGGGSCEEKLKNQIKDSKLEEHFKLLGIKSNPFPYVKNSDLYVLCSRHEGYCLATTEAKILGKVIIATDIDSNREQINDGINGFLCPIDADYFADKIIEVTNDRKLIKRIEKNLSEENFDRSEEFKKLYKLI